MSPRTKAAKGPARARAKSKPVRQKKPSGAAANRAKKAGRPPIRATINRLEREYPDSRIVLDFKSPLELLVATILAAQCTDERVNLVTKTLFSRYKKPSEYARAPLEDLMELVRSTGFFRNKSKSLQAACAKIVADYGGVPRTMEELITLPGVARKTANIVLGDAFGLSEGIAVDTHMLRLSKRLGLTLEKDPVKVERDLCALVPRSKWIHFPHLIADHGRAVCKARTPHCYACVLAKLCPSRP
jgi:endonuclease-3